MLFERVYTKALEELNMEYDWSPHLFKYLQNHPALNRDGNFICEQLSQRLLNLISLYRQQFQLKISEIDSNSDHTCGYVLQCFSNGYREFCNLPESDHEHYVVEKAYPKHVFLNKNINNIIDYQYQEGILVLENFMNELAVLLISKLVGEWLLTHSTKATIDYQNSEQLREYDTLMLNDPRYFRSNHLIENNVSYYCLNEKLESPVATQTDEAVISDNSLCESIEG